MTNKPEGWFFILGIKCDEWKTVPNNRRNCIIEISRNPSVVVVVLEP